MCKTCCRSRDSWQRQRCSWYRKQGQALLAELQAKRPRGFATKTHSNPVHVLVTRIATAQQCCARFLSVAHNLKNNIHLALPLELSPRFKTKARQHCRFFLTWQREISTVELHIAKQDLHRHRPMRELGARRVAAAIHALHCHLSYAPPPWPRHANAAALHVPRRLLKPRHCQRLVCTATSSSAPASYSAPGRGRSARSVPLLLCC